MVQRRGFTLTLECKYVKTVNDKLEGTT